MMNPGEQKEGIEGVGSLKGLDLGTIKENNISLYNLYSILLIVSSYNDFCPSNISREDFL